MLHALLFVLGLWFVTIWAFVAVMHARAVMKREALTLFWKVHLLPLAVAGFVLDVAFNLSFGSAMFIELPRELLFTSRCKRHYRTTDVSHWRYRLARWWRKNLNQFDRNHID
jgi:hypothetical protein